MVYRKENMRRLPSSKSEKLKVGFSFSRLTCTHKNKESIAYTWNALQLNVPKPTITFVVVGKRYGWYMDGSIMIDRPWYSQASRSVFPVQTVCILDSHILAQLKARRRDEDRSGNCPAGFVADKGITSPIARDFYLLSHAGILGSMSETLDPFQALTMRPCLFQRAALLIISS
jgi:hypothetical protein